MQEHLYKCIVFLFLNYLKKQMSFNHLYLIEQHLLSLGSLTVGYQKKVPAGRIKPAFFVSNFWFLSIVFYCNVL